MSVPYTLTSSVQEVQVIFFKKKKKQLAESWQSLGIFIKP